MGIQTLNCADVQFRVSLGSFIAIVVCPVCVCGGGGRREGGGGGRGGGREGGEEGGGEEGGGYLTTSQRSLNSTKLTSLKSAGGCMEGQTLERTGSIARAHQAL